MGYLPQFSHDLFVSYRRVSNETPDRWVDTFCDDMRSQLRERVGDVEIWRDIAELRAGDAWRPQIAAAVESTGIFLALMARTYFDSDECRKELDRFLGRLKAPDGGAGRKLVPIFKHPARNPAELPNELREIGHHEFFVQEPRGWRELDRRRDADDYWERMSRMVQDLTQALEDLHGRQKKQALGTVFIGRVAPELLQMRERLRADLQQRGFLVVPENEYLWNAADHAQRITNDLDQALLCVHLVSCNASIEPLTSGRDKAQMALAQAAMARRGKPPPLVWIQAREPLHAVAPEQQALIDYIQNDLCNAGVEYLQGSLEELKTQVLEMLPAPQPAPSQGLQPTPPAAAVQPRRIALLVEAQDLADAGPLKALLVGSLGLDVRTLLFNADRPDDAARLAKTLALCAQVIVFWSRQPEDWVTDLFDLGALAGHLGPQRLCVVASGTASAQKSSFASPSATTVLAFAGPDAAGLRAFVAQWSALGNAVAQVAGPSA